MQKANSGRAKRFGVSRKSKTSTEPNGPSVRVRRERVWRHSRLASEGVESTRRAAARASARRSPESEFARGAIGSVGISFVTLRRSVRTSSQKARATALSQEESRVVSVRSRRPGSQLRTPVSPTVRTPRVRLSGRGLVRSAGPVHSALVRRWCKARNSPLGDLVGGGVGGPQFTDRAPPIRMVQATPHAGAGRAARE